MTVTFRRQTPPKQRRPSKYSELVEEAVQAPEEWFLVEGTTYNGLHNACDPSGSIYRILLEEHADKFRPEVTSRDEQRELYFRVVER